ncbi:hypothetical protein P691DRAFT_810403 [Macrolepiota fuliginosa MF-IS2]|uniref:Uncharacterized protein n=1 Tax=Macrolepiota fuliginosa MF-IS2 TaxID=1400762 RepID=A0A9P6BX33_9AGAR|nr:hypothetical protein P691DRAFT_810403 [Macrolepiota fuliginosa MF-IS2]
MYPESIFAANLERWGVLKTVPLQSFKFNDIRFDLHPQIYRYEEGGANLQVGWHTAGRGDVVPALERMFRAAKIVNSRGEEPTDFEGMNVSDEPTWQADLETNLAAWTDMAPSHPVTMFGRGRKSCACFQFNVPGELWVLTLPCVQPS